MTKSQIKNALDEIEVALIQLQRRYPGQEMRPWACGDHPAALEHWGLIQRRIALKRETPRADLTAEQRKAAGERLQKARGSVLALPKPTDSPAVGPCHHS